MDELGEKKQNNKNQLKNKNNKSLKTKIEKRTSHFSKKKLYWSIRVLQTEFPGLLAPFSVQVHYNPNQSSSRSGYDFQ